MGGGPFDPPLDVWGLMEVQSFTDLKQKTKSLISLSYSKGKSSSYSSLLW